MTTTKLGLQDRLWFKTELVYWEGPSPGADDLELATLGWVDWFNHRWIHAELDYRTPAEIGTEHYRVHNETAQQPRADYQAL